MATCRKWLLVDFLYIVILSQLRIPRLEYKTPSVVLQVALLWLIDGLLFGGISINLPVFWGTGLTLSSGLPGALCHRPLCVTALLKKASFLSGFGIRDVISPLTFGLISSAGEKDGHLLGQHTVRMSPISTAHFNPQNQNYCLSPSVGHVLVPIVLNNTQLAGLRYSIAPLGSEGKLEVHDVTAKELKVMEQAYRDRTKHLAQPVARSTTDDSEYDEYDYDDEEELQDAHANLGHTQSLAHLMLTKPGIVRLERAVDATGATARLVMADTVVVPCPTVSFAPDEGAALEPVRCAHGRTDPRLRIKVGGVPPLSLKWMRGPSMGIGSNSSWRVLRASRPELGERHGRRRMPECWRRRQGTESLQDARACRACRRSLSR
jgi:nucleoporin POM152